VVDGAVNGVGLATRLGGRKLRLVQTGKVQWYAAVLFLGVGLLALVFVLKSRL
jgi:hypothetical protein